MSEAAFFARCRHAWKSSGTPVHVSRIESLVGSGVPDVWLSAAGRQPVMVELKWMGRTDRQPRIRPMQAEWHRQEAQAGRHGWLLAGLDSGHVWAQGGKYVALAHNDLYAVYRGLLVEGKKLPDIPGWHRLTKLSTFLDLLPFSHSR